MRIFEKKVKKNSYQIENHFKKSENFTLGVHYSDKHHGVNSNPVSFYNQNREDIKNTFKVQIPIKYSILRIFPKFQLEQKLEQVTFVLLVGLKLKKYHFQGEILDSMKGAKYIEIAKLCIRFFFLLLIHVKTNTCMIANSSGYYS